MATPASAQKTRNAITLRGSTQIVKEFFLFSIQSILYQRGIYRPDAFRPEKKYGLTMMTTRDQKLGEYLHTVTSQLEVWLMRGNVQKLVVVVQGVETKEVLERWVFRVEADKDVVAGGTGGAVRHKSQKDIT